MLYRKWLVAITINYKLLKYLEHTRKRACMLKLNGPYFSKILQFAEHNVNCGYNNKCVSAYLQCASIEAQYNGQTNSEPNKKNFLKG